MSEKKNTEIRRYKRYPEIKLTEEQQDFLKQLKIFKAKGVMITIDNRQLPVREWDKLFRFAEGSSRGSNQFYMSDYVIDETGGINEIRLDKITVR